ncbi:hypothetical protein AAP_05974 [Ascosphaera apis ARSEF 7405]|uniref:Tafazzin n=1 Tax=Ascosphaera apis ARSEF 7405 TaxID=392613 RepID=A0A167V4D7_9EURO|nr:hypothetical protein AAP_05974 [Ascosphaera apis ARSEF 7405]
MPSKHRQFKSPKPQPTVHPSLQSSSPRSSRSSSSARSRASSYASQPGVSTTPSVNDLISHLRRTQISSSAAAAASAAASISPAQRSLPPQLRNVLDIPDTPPPRPRARRSIGHVIVGRSRSAAPGPAAPRSWLNPRDRDRNDPALHGGNERGALRSARRRIWRFQRLPGTKFAAQDSLMHTVLKSMARRWDYHLVYDNVFLAELPDTLKQLLLSYVAYYTPHDVIEVGMKGLKPLFLDISADTGTFLDHSGVVRLDLENAIGRWISIRQLTREIKGWTEDSKAKGKIQEKTKSRPPIGVEAEEAKSEAQPKEAEAIPISWEDEVDTPTSTISTTTITKPVFSSRFSSLRYLSLANPHGLQSASWSSLLSLLPNVSRLTHLSLAYWPPPTLTTNSLRARIRHPTIPLSFQYSGTDIYSAYEGDWSEAASVLKKLSKATYCLKWLDLEGCMEWVDALTYGYSGEFTSSSSSEGELSGAEDGLIVRNGKIGPDWNGSWRMLEWLRLSVGWNPEDDAWAMDDTEVYALEQAKARHRELTTKAHSAGRRILDIRKQGKRKWVHISHGEDDDDEQQDETSSYI